MKKVWIYKRKGVKGWYESGKRKAKALPTRKLAQHYCQLVTGCDGRIEVNGTVFTFQKSSLSKELKVDSL